MPLLCISERVMHLVCVCAILIELFIWWCDQGTCHVGKDSRCEASGHLGEQDG